MTAVPSASAPTLDEQLDTVAYTRRPLPLVTDPNDARYTAPPGSGTAAFGIFLPYQRRWVADEALVKIAEKSRRVGLTWAEAGDDVLIAASQEEAGGQDVFYIGFNKEMALEYIETAAQWARAINQAAAVFEEGVLEDEDKQIQVYRIRFDSGHKIMALSSRPSNLRGKQGIVVLDEAAFHDDPNAVLKAALALLMWGGKVRIISTHLGVDNPFNELILDARSGKAPYAVHTISFEQAVREGLYQRICHKLKRVWSPEAERAWVDEIRRIYRENAAEELDVIPSSSSGAFLSAALVAARMEPAIPLIRLELLPEWMLQAEERRRDAVTRWCEAELAPLLRLGMNPFLATFVGQDVGRSGDLSAIWVLQVQPDMVRRTSCVVELRNVPFSAQEQILWYVCDRVPRFGGAKIDATGIGAQLAENTVLRYGAMVEAVKLNETWYREHMPVFKKALEDGEWVLPKHVDVATDLRAIKLIRGVPKIDDQAAAKGSDGKPRHADTAIAAVMADAASRGEHAAYGGYVGAGRRDSFGVGQDHGALGFDDGAGGSRWRARQRGF